MIYYIKFFCNKIKNSLFEHFFCKTPIHCTDENDDVQNMHNKKNTNNQVCCIDSANRPYFINGIPQYFQMNQDDAISFNCSQNSYIKNDQTLSLQCDEINSQLHVHFAPNIGFNEHCIIKLKYLLKSQWNNHLHKAKENISYNNVTRNNTYYNKDDEHKYYENKPIISYESLLILLSAMLFIVVLLNIWCNKDKIKSCIKFNCIKTRKSLPFCRNKHEKIRLQKEEEENTDNLMHSYEQTVEDISVIEQDTISIIDNYAPEDKSSISTKIFEKEEDLSNFTNSISNKNQENNESTLSLAKVRLPCPCCEAKTDLDQSKSKLSMERLYTSPISQLDSLCLTKSQEYSSKHAFT